MEAKIQWGLTECIIIIHKETDKAYYVTQVKGKWVNPVQFWIAKSNISKFESIKYNLKLKKKSNQKTKIIKKKKQTEHKRIRALHKRMKLKQAVCRCGSTKDLQLHHITYTEKPNVITLCKQCHAKEHPTLSKLFE